MLTGKTRHRIYDGRLILQVEEHRKPRMVKVKMTYIAEPRTEWRDATVTDLQELHGFALEDAKTDAFRDGFDHALEEQEAARKGKSDGGPTKH